jgi:osmoprotectant transport system ATP-binding protein
MIRVQSVTKSFGALTILKNISFEVSPGETKALLGLSGSGKTTALKIVCGLHTPDSGTVEINGEVLSNQNLRSQRRKLGYVIQDGGLFPHLTARQNISLVGEEVSLSQEKIRARIEELAELVRIPLEYLDRYPRELSGGQRQRIGIMRAMLLDPPILLMDEPMGALDPITRQDLQVELKEIFSRLKKSVLMVTHDLYEAGYLSDSILLLSEGELIQEAPLKELIQNPANDFVRLFVGSQTHGRGSP